MITGETTPLTNIRPNKLEQAEKIFFFERNDGKIIAVKEQEAWNLYTRKVQVLGYNKKVVYTLIGVGDGLIFQNAVAEAQSITSNLENLPKMQDIIRKGQEAELEACRGRIIPPRDMDKIA